MHPSVWGLALVSVVAAALPGWLVGCVDPENGQLPLEPDAGAAAGDFELELQLLAAAASASTMSRTTGVRRSVMQPSVAGRCPLVLIPTGWLRPTGLLTLAGPRVPSCPR